jgi:hypothetical protein
VCLDCRIEEGRAVTSVTSNSALRYLRVIRALSYNQS